MRICNHILENRNGRLILCGEPVRYEGSFVCEKHIWDTSKKKKTIKEMQEALKSWR